MNTTENNINYKKKLIILEDAKIYVRKNGWTKNLLKKLINSKTKSYDLGYLFPNGYSDLLSLALNEINKSLENKISKINIINFSISKRMKKILQTRLEILDADKIFYRKLLIICCFQTNQN